MKVVSTVLVALCSWHALGCGEEISAIAGKLVAKV
jgi:hypothetical protein